MDWLAEIAERTAADGDVPSGLPEVCPGNKARQSQAVPITNEVNPINPEADNRAGSVRIRTLGATLERRFPRRSDQAARVSTSWIDPGPPRPNRARLKPSGLVGAERIELSTPCLKGRRSTERGPSVYGSNRFLQ